MSAFSAPKGRPERQIASWTELQIKTSPECYLQRREEREMSGLSDEAKLHALLEIYDQDREEERVQWNRLHNLFTMFMLLFLGATNAFLQLAEPPLVTWAIFTLSVLIATLLYWYLHNKMTVRLVDAAKIKEGREILLKMLLNGTDVRDYQENLVCGDSSVKDLDGRINSPAYPFLAFHDIIRLKLTYREHAKKYLVAATGFVVVLLTLGYCLLD